MSNGKAMITWLLVGLIKKMLYSQYTKINKYFPKPYDPFRENFKVELNLSNYATKTGLKKNRVSLV